MTEANNPSTQREVRKGSFLARIIAVTNQKGGVGKTTTAVNLSASLAMAGASSLLVDMDPQGNASSGLGHNPRELAKSIYHALLGEVGLSSVLKSTGIPGLNLLPSQAGLSGLEVELVGREKRSYYLKQLLSTVEDQYDYIIIDSPPSLGLLTVNVLCAANSLLIPIQCEYYALEGLGQLLNVVKRVQEGLNPALQVEGILLTMYDKRLSLSRQVAQEAIRYFDDKVYRTMIPRNVKLSEAPSFGKPIVLYDIESTGARSYIQLAQEVMNAEKGIGKGA